MWDNNDIVTVRWIMDTAQARYKEWKWQCHNVYQEHGPEGMPTEFYGREDEWAFLCTHFESDAFKVCVYCFFFWVIMLTTIFWSNILLILVQ